jgi:hypothetical protein
MLEEEIVIKVKRQALENHVKKICSSNLKKPCKICTTCPFLNYVLEIMDYKGWKYNPKILEYKKEK